MTDWIDLPKDLSKHLGMIYLITHDETGKFYCGKKIFWNKIRRKPLKGKKRIRRDLKESDYQDYWGSSNEFIKFVEKEGKDKFTRRVVKLCNSKFDLAYEELLFQLSLDVLNNPLSYNEILNVRLRKKKNRGD